MPAGGEAFEVPAGGDEEEVGEVAADAAEEVGEDDDDDDDNEILFTKSQKNKKRSSSSSRMTITRHPADKKAKTKASPATTSKTSRTTTSKNSETPKKAEKWSDGVELSDDHAPFAAAAAVARGTRKFSPLGFLIMFCQSDFGAVSTATDTRKRSIIEFIEDKYKVLCN